MRAIHN